MPKDPSLELCNCLYFTANSLARVISLIAEEEFAVTGMSPSHAFVLMLVNASPGLPQKELSRHLNLDPSTVTRFIDTLVHRGYLERRSAGKISQVYPTEKGRQLQETISLAWRSLFQRYSQVLGVEQGRQLTRLIDQASQKLDL